MSILEVSADGEPLKIEVNETTIADDVVKIINRRWPGTARVLADNIADMDNAFRDASGTIEEAFEAEKRKQKAIDRIAWKAEAEQRRANGGHWR